ncbi:MAG: hypothetical protein ACE5F4_00260 [Candidatus Paceibacteria bacterium]
MLEVAEELLDSLYPVRELVSDVFDLKLPEPQLTTEGWEALCGEGGKYEGMSVEDVQRQYAEELIRQISVLQKSIDTLIIEIKAGIENGTIPDTPKIQAFLDDLSHQVIIDKDGNILDPGGLREMIGTGKWMLEKYDFDTETITYYTFDEERGIWVLKEGKMSPEQVLSDAAWYANAPRAILKTSIPDILRLEEARRVV